jgi:hypothetical protein
VAYQNTGTARQGPGKSRVRQISNDQGILRPDATNPVHGLGEIGSLKENLLRLLLLRQPQPQQK